MIRATILAFVLATVPSLCFGQCRKCMPGTLFSWSGQRDPLGDLDSIATDRPDFTETSSTVGLGVTQLEMGYTFTSFDDSRSHSWGEPLIRHGLLANWLELRFAAAPVSLRETATTSGFEDIYLGAKIALTQQERLLPEMAIVPQMTVPSGSSGFSAERVLPGVNLLYGWDVTDKLSFAGSTQYNRAVDDRLIPYDEWAQSLTIGRSITETVGSYIEWYAFLPNHAENAHAAHYLNGGFTYLLSDDVQFDIRAGKGLNDEADDCFFGTGVSFRWQ